MLWLLNSQSLNPSARFSESLADVLKKMLLISQVAGLAKEIEKDSVAMDQTSPDSLEAFGYQNRENLRGVVFDEDFTSTAFSPNEESPTTDTEKEIDTSKRCPLTGKLHASEKLKLMQLLDQWEEPDRSFDPNQVRPSCL
jgi:hypothetical protein